MSVTLFSVVKQANDSSFQKWDNWEMYIFFLPILFTLIVRWLTLIFCLSIESGLRSLVSKSMRVAFVRGTFVFGLARWFWSSDLSGKEPKMFTGVVAFSLSCIHCLWQWDRITVFVSYWETKRCSITPLCLTRSTFVKESMTFLYIRCLHSQYFCTEAKIRDFSQEKVFSMFRKGLKSESNFHTHQILYPRLVLGIHLLDFGVIIILTLPQGIK